MKLDLTPHERDALARFACQQGRQWKAALRDMWMNGSYWGTETNAPMLQFLRNSARFGPAGLVAIRPADLLPQ